MQLRAMVMALSAMFGFVAALMAYLITHEEYTHHFHDRGRVVRTSLKVAAVAFLFFFGMGLVFAVFSPGI